MFIEIGEAAQIKPVLDTLLGIDTGGYVRLAGGPHAIPGVFEAGHSDEELGKLSAPCTSSASRCPRLPAARSPTAEVALVVDHPGRPRSHGPDPHRPPPPRRGPRVRRAGRADRRPGRRSPSAPAAAEAQPRSRARPPGLPRAVHRLSLRRPRPTRPRRPRVKGSSRELLEAKVLHGKYPPGYRPKRPTAVMPPSRSWPRHPGARRLPPLATLATPAESFLSERPDLGGWRWAPLAGGRRHPSTRRTSRSATVERVPEPAGQGRQRSPRSEIRLPVDVRRSREAERAEALSRAAV